MTTKLENSIMEEAITLSSQMSHNSVKFKTLYIFYKNVEYIQNFSKNFNIHSNQLSIVNKGLVVIITIFNDSILFYFKATFINIIKLYIIF